MNLQVPSKNLLLEGLIEVWEVEGLRAGEVSGSRPTVLGLGLRLRA